MTGSGLGAEEEGAFRRRRLKRLKGRVRGMGRGIPCKLSCLFCKYCLSAITVASRGLRVGIYASKKKVTTAELHHKLLELKSNCGVAYKAKSFSDLNCYAVAS